MIELKKLKHKCPDVGFQYTGQPIEDVESALQLLGVKAMGNKLVTANDDGTLQVNHWSCCDTSLEIGDWVVLDDPNGDLKGGSGMPDIFTTTAIEKYYIVE